MTTTPRSPSRCWPHRGGRMVVGGRGLGAWVGCPCRCRGKRRHNLKYVRPSPPHHTTPHHIPSHHTTLSCVPSTPRCGRWREGDLARCGRGCGCARVAVLSRGVGVGLGKSTRACGADAFNDAFFHTLQPGCLALVVTVQSPTNGRPRRLESSKRPNLNSESLVSHS